MTPRVSKPAALLGLMVLLPSLTGCYNTQLLRVAPPAVEESQHDDVIGVTTLDSEDVPFAGSGEIRGETVYGTIETPSATGTVEEPYEIPLSQVARLWIEEKRMEWARFLTGLAVLTGAVLAVIMDPES